MFDLPNGRSIYIHAAMDEKKIRFIVYFRELEAWNKKHDIILYLNTYYSN